MLSDPLDTKQVISETLFPDNLLARTKKKVKNQEKQGGMQFDNWSKAAALDF